MGMTSMAAGMHARGMEREKQWHGRVLVGCNGRGEREGLGPVLGTRSSRRGLVAAAAPSRAEGIRRMEPKVGDDKTGPPVSG